MDNYARRHKYPLKSKTHVLAVMQPGLLISINMIIKLKATKPPKQTKRRITSDKGRRWGEGDIDTNYNKNNTKHKLYIHIHIQQP